MKRKIIKKCTIVLLLISSIFLVVTFQSQDNDKKKHNNKKIYQDISTLSVRNNENIILNYQKEFNNEEIIAELSIENTNLVTPIVKGTDNEFYLNHYLDKSKNDLGSNFLDYRNNIDDKKILIYGHNSENVYTDFHLLENYLDEEYYYNHNDITLKTIDNVYNYKIFSIYIATTALQHVNLNFTDDEYSKHLNWLKNNSIYNTGVNIESNSEILVLQTCYFDIDNSYLIVVAKKV